MHLTYENPGFSHSLESILLFETDDQSPWWRKALFHFYPQLDPEKAGALDLSARRAYYEEQLAPVWEKNLPLLAQKVEAYNRWWNENEKVVTQAFSESFGRDLSRTYEDVKGWIALGCVCPRFLDRRAFDVFYLNSERGALGLALHEMTHFIWFDIWHEHFQDDPAGYEAPSLIWILSEMAVHPILSHPRLRALDPYYKLESGGCVYPYFYTLRLEGRALLDVLGGFYRPGHSEEFMERAYAYVQEHEAAIRAHIRKSEEI